jgi:arylformamidase
MRLIDLSQPLFDACPNCPVHPPVKSEFIATHEKDGWLVEKLTLSNHTGSHVDAPLHKIAGGKCLDDIPLERWVGPAWIMDLRDSAADRPITEEVLEETLPHLPADQIVLLATGWGDRRAKTDEWWYHSPFVHPSGAQWLADHKARGVGIDHYSIGGFGPENPETHSILLGNDVWIVEELRFPLEVFDLPQPVTFWSLPINLKGHTGAFCRPVIVDDRVTR